MLEGSYDLSLVLVSCLVAVLASFTSLAMAARAARACHRGATWAWRLGGGGAMGLGIWCMHFIGMLAFSLPIALGYDLFLTLASLAIALGASVYALWLVSLPSLCHWRLGGGAFLVGMGIAAMHYVGMAAMHMQPSISWSPGWVVISLLVAVAACWLALFIAFRMRSHPARLSARLGAACLLGLGIVGMHYTGMAAARFPMDSVCGALDATSLPITTLALLVATMTVLILGLALGLSWMEQHLETQLLRIRNTYLSHSLDDAQAELTQAALHDPLTRLPNRRLLQQRIEQALALAESTGSRFAVMFIDLDGFKQVNDAYGHQTGDALLVAASERFSRLLHPAATLARLGGDEFVVVTGIGNHDDIVRLAQQMLESVAAGLLVGGHPLQVTASIGIALCPDHAASERQLMACADAAMYQAKGAGRNRYALHAERVEGSDAAQGAGRGQPTLQLHGDKRLPPR